MAAAALADRGGPRGDRVDAARSLLARAEMAAGLRTRLVADAVALPAGLGALFPGGLARGGVVAISGSTSLGHTMAAAAMGDSGWLAAIGVTDTGWLAAAEAGVDLTRVVHVPRPRGELDAVTAACVDGFDVVLLGSAVELGTGSRRSLLGRIRAHGTVVVSLAPWPGAVRLRAEVHGAQGCHRGAGHVRVRTLSVSRDGMAGIVTLHMPSDAGSCAGPATVLPADGGLHAISALPEVTGPVPSGRRQGHVASRGLRVVS